MFKKIINVISVVFLVLIVCFVLFTFVSRIMGNTPSVFGYYIFRVSSDSMEPTLMVGDVILVHKADPEDIQKIMAWLRGLNVKRRVEALISIAHPDFRDWLREEAEKNQIW